MDKGWFNKKICLLFMASLYLPSTLNTDYWISKTFQHNKQMISYFFLCFYVIFLLFYAFFLFTHVICFEPNFRKYKNTLKTLGYNLPDHIQLGKSYEFFFGKKMTQILLLFGDKRFLCSNLIQPVFCTHATWCFEMINV